MRPPAIHRVRPLADRITGRERCRRYARRLVTDDPRLPLLTRLWFAWLCFIRVLFDARFAARVWGIREAAELPAPATPALAAPRPDGTPPAPPDLNDGGAPAPVPVRSAATPTAPALQLLSLLQREGRLVDFLQQDITSFSDADIGVAARVVHEGCRRALRAHVEIEPVLPDDEGARVRLAAGFDADEVRLVGDVQGEPPYTGVLRHRGWRASKLELPQIVGDHDARVLAPAEVELG
jgi:hypothetical protein